MLWCRRGGVRRWGWCCSGMEMVETKLGRWWRSDDDGCCDDSSGVVVAGEMEVEMMVVARWRGAVDLAEAAGGGGGAWRRPQYVDLAKSLPSPLPPAAIIEPTKDDNTEMEQVFSSMGQKEDSLENELAQHHTKNWFARDKFSADSGKEYLELTYSARMKVQFTRECAIMTDCAEIAHNVSIHKRKEIVKRVAQLDIVVTNEL
ncbi:60S ribosomal protein L32-1 [Tanacetum coccineum]